jgi:hypothetical protein
VLELHYIAPISNLVSILQRGLICHELVSKIEHHSVALENIQTRRARKIVPNGLPLHSYVNLYFHARNPMLSRLRSQHNDLCVLRINSSVLDLPNVVITSQNASSDYVRFYPSPGGLDYLDKDMVFAESWIHDNQIDEWRHKSIKCAEVLVPKRIDSVYIIGGYVFNQITKERVEALLKNASLELEISVNSHLFFASAI